MMTLDDLIEQEGDSSSARPIAAVKREGRERHPQLSDNEATASTEQRSVDACPDVDWFR
jgi:hypothetical protein